MHVNLDIEAIQNIAHTGIRRASSFLAIGLEALKDGPPRSVTLGEHMKLLFMPDPLPDDVAAETAANYRAWLTGSALKELDHSFALFLEEVWQVGRLAQLHGKPSPEFFPPDQKFNQQSADKKLKEVIGLLGAEAPWAEYFYALGKARNCLTHGNGIVRERDSTEATRLILKWRYPSIILKNDVAEYQWDMRQPPPDHPMQAETNVIFRMVEREQIFEVGQPLVLSKEDVAEICLMVQATTGAIINALVAYLHNIGIREP